MKTSIKQQLREWDSLIDKSKKLNENLSVDISGFINNMVSRRQLVAAQIGKQNNKNRRG